MRMFILDPQQQQQQLASVDRIGIHGINVRRRRSPPSFWTIKLGLSVDHFGSTTVAISDDRKVSLTVIYGHQALSSSSSSSSSFSFSFSSSSSSPQSLFSA